MKLGKSSLISIGTVIVGVIGVILSELQNDSDKKKLHDDIKAEVLAELRESE